MFTGLIREIGRLAAIAPRAGVTRIDMTAPLCAPQLEIGDSLAVNGICLTVTQRSGTRVTVEAAAETRRVTTLPNWRVGDRVHLEPALRAADRLGGHLVLGHVDGQGQLQQVRRTQGSWYLTFALPAELAQYLLPKGSVAVDGISLTVDSGPFHGRFTVNVIPHTWTRTRLSELKVGQAVNLEMDLVVKAARGQGLPPVTGRAPVDLPSGVATAPAGRPGSPAQAAAASPSPAHAGKAPLTVADLLARGFRRRHDR
jgi:riboflavin synthase